jgi:hypothetical protein
VLFNVYINCLIVALRDLRLGCHIRGMFLGCLLYADDLTLISGSVIELQRMLDTCERVGDKLGLKFNSKKSACLVVGPNKLGTPTPMLVDGQLIEWKEKIAYLGVILLAGTSFKIDLSDRRRKFFAAVNSVLSHCSHTSDLVKLELVEKHCLPILLYCVESLDLDYVSIKMLNTCWNSVYRKIFGFSYMVSVKCLINSLGRLDVHHLINLRSLLFIRRLRIFDSATIQVLYKNVRCGPESTKLSSLFNTKLDWSDRLIKRTIVMSFNAVCLNASNS